MIRDIVIASRNKGKIAEILQIFHDLPVRWSSVTDHPAVPEVVEDGDSYRDNALKKAVAVAKATGLWSLADDSGLEVDALGGRPGVHSALFAGRHGDDAANNERLLRDLAGVPDERRTARYRAVIVVADPQGRILAEAEGTCEGAIGRELRGGSGFGYDPLFLVPDFSQTMAELGLDIKNRISHRARALEALRDPLAERLRVS